MGAPDTPLSQSVAAELQGAPILGTIVPILGSCPEHTTMPPSPSRPAKDLGTALFGKGRRNILGVLFTNPAHAFYLREIMALTGGGSGQVQREMNNLHAAGLVLKDKRGLQVFYRANAEASVFDDLRNLVTRTFGVSDVVADMLKPFAANITAAFIYGSVAKRSDTANSDVDVLIVGRVRLSDFAERLSQAEQRLRRSISPVIYSRKDFVEKSKSRNHFLTAVLAGPKIHLVGDQRKLDGLLSG